MTKLLAIALLFSSAVSAMDINEIRDLYSSVNGMIENNELYLSELKINSEGKMYPATGIFNRLFRFFWTHNADSIQWEQLLLIRVSSQYAAVEEYEEYLYNTEGELVFYFRTGGYSDIQERYYFCGEDLLRYTCGENREDNPDSGTRSDGDQILLTADKYLQSFQMLHQ